MINVNLNKIFDKKNAVSQTVYWFVKIIRLHKLEFGIQSSLKKIDGLQNIKISSNIKRCPNFTNITSYRNAYNANILEREQSYM